MIRQLAAIAKAIEKDQEQQRLEQLQEHVDRETDKRVRHKRELKAQEAKLDAYIASCQPWPDRWWWGLSRLNIVRRQLIEAAKEFQGGGL